MADRLLRVIGASVIFLSGCATLPGSAGQPLVPTRHQVRTGPFTVFSGVPVANDSGVIRSLQRLERDITANLGLHVETLEPPIEIYVLRDRESFSQFLTFHHPELPARRAFFLAKGSQRLVYTFFNDRLEDDLRHEATHALLHATIGNLPLWLDEGLAEYFEGGRETLGLNEEHVAKLPDDLKSGWRPDLARLESLKTVADMSPRDYRESWAWVHFLLTETGGGRSAILGYLADLRENPDRAELLSARLARMEGSSGARLLAHLKQVRPAQVASRPNPMAISRSTSEPKVLFQNAPLLGEDPTPRRGFFGRFLNLFRSPGRGLASPNPDR